MLIREFTDYSPQDVPPIPNSWTDVSWHNDACPSFIAAERDGAQLQVWVDYADPAKRECGEDLPRYRAYWYDHDTGDVKKEIIESDDWNAVLTAVERELS